MSPHILMSPALGYLLQLLLQISWVHSAIIPQSVGLAGTNVTLGDDSAVCVQYEGWVGDGIRQSDCVDAINEFYRTNVQPRGKQEYEFRIRGEPQTTVLPSIMTPWKYDQGE